MMLEERKKIILTITLIIVLILSIPINVKALSLPLSQLESKAHTYHDNGRYLQEISFLKQALTLNPNDPRLLTNLGVAENQISNFIGALFYLKKALSIDSHYTAALFSLGSVFDSLGNHSQALVYFKEVLSLSPSLIEKALALTYLGNYSQALNTIKYVLKTDPTNLDALSTKGIIMLYQNNSTGALYLFNKLPSSFYVPWVLDDKAIALTGLGNNKEALSYFNKSLLLNPKDVYALYNKALTLQKMRSLQNISAAISLYQKVLKITPNNSDALANLKIGICQELFIRAHISGNYTAALQCANKVLR